MKRLFTFGCSFTQYWRWPTWADMLSKQYDQAENWGLCGTGNCYIFYSLMECHKRNLIGPEDSVYVMWTNTSREDRYLKDRWIEGGNVYWDGHPLGIDYRRKWSCERGYLIRDLAVMAAAKELLQSWQCDWRFFCMVPLDHSNQDNDLGANPDIPGHDNRDVAQLYRDVLSAMAPSVYETVFNGDWFSGEGIPDVNDPGRRDFHPSPREHVAYIDAVAPGLIAESDQRQWMYQCEDLLRSGDLDWRPLNLPAHRL
jgi:hypothetical protein